MAASSTTLSAEISITSEDEQDQVDAFIVKRTDRILNIGFQPSWTPEERAGVVEEYRRALRHHPQWVLSKAFDRSVGSCANRPTPGNINAAAMSITKGHRDELARRQRVEARNEAEWAERQAQMPSGDKTTEMLREAGFTPERTKAVNAQPMVSSFAEADAVGDCRKKPHWTETEAPDSPKMAALRKARDANPLIQQARAYAAAQAEAEAPEDAA